MSKPKRNYTHQHQTPIERDFLKQIPCKISETDAAPNKIRKTLLFTVPFQKNPKRKPALFCC
ncbi:uncharacterized protein BYT42DRAFT_589505 [Radiomyces spectabilis]|uniref:uncharacterized protein n=1 Tax=Radiomyces spectabilis TaxID=64574 RepID=UPI00221FEBA2|nr:uncharacterized protein BYT42DRAFT_589505 [Radiomyces spectabilis]KAI8365311.1 hypothetical protein BYT42DRAFT_589505 [Radiomyces spectabilis]